MLESSQNLSHINDFPNLLSFYLKNSKASYVMGSLIRKEGSSYRKLGARMLIREDQEYAGCLSGGCLESEIVIAAQNNFRNQQPQLIQFDARRYYGCDGKISILLEGGDSRINSLFDKIHDKWQKRNPISLITDCRKLESAETTLICGYDDLVNKQDQLIVRDLLPIRMIVIGNTTDTLPLVQLGHFLNWQVFQIKDRIEYTNSDCCDATNSDTQHCSPSQFAERYPSDSHTAVVVMTHNFATDAHYLNEILKQNYPYVGMLGSKKRRNEVIDAILYENPDYTPFDFSRFHSPIGLNIGSHDPKTIALSITSEIQAVFAGVVSSTTPQTLAST